MFHNGNQPRATFETTLPSISSFFHAVPCEGCRQNFDDLHTLHAHQATCGMRGPAPFQHGMRTQYPPLPSSSGASDTDSTVALFTPSSSRESSVSFSQHRSQSTSRVTKTKVTKSNQRRPSAAIVPEHDRKAKKTEKEKHNRSLQAAVVARHEDTLFQYCGWERIEQSGGNGNSAGLTSCKINVLRAEEAVGAHLLHVARCQAIRTGTLADFEREMQQIAEGCLAPDYRPGDGTFLELPQGELPCSHEDTKSKVCNVHGHADWIDCRKTRKAAIFRSREDSYIASLGMTREQAMYGSRAAPTQQAHPSLSLPHRHSRH